MGVTGLWNVLHELCERKDLSFLSDKRVAVDLSGWVVQATQTKGLNSSKNPHLRNLFFRVSQLLQDGVHPIFVTEGKVPKLKENAFRERNHCGGKQGDGVSRSQFDALLHQCTDLLTVLGVPCIKSSYEAEAMCGFLCSQGIVDGVITEDNDAFLYGAHTVFRGYTISPKDRHVNMYSLKSPKNKMNLDRRKLIALALLLGCDYTKGVPSIGTEAATKFLNELKDCDPLERFRDWRRKSESDLFPGFDSTVRKKMTHCSRCSHSGSINQHKKEGCSMCDSEIECYNSDEKRPCICLWHKANAVLLRYKTELKVFNASKNVSNFPSEDVIAEYLDYYDIVPIESQLEWRCPDLNKFATKNFFNWTVENGFLKGLPIVTSWQMIQLSKSHNCTNFRFKPVKVQPKTVDGKQCLEIEWSMQDENEGLILDGETKLKSIVNKARFETAYPDVYEAYARSRVNNKAVAKSKSKKSAKSSGKQQMITDIFPVRKNKISSKSIKDMEVNGEEGNCDVDSDALGHCSKKLCASPNHF